MESGIRCTGEESEGAEEAAPGDDSLGVAAPADNKGLGADAPESPVGEGEEAGGRGRSPGSHGT